MSTNDIRKFWMIKGAGPTSVRHPRRDIAESEADRLARQNPGEVFVVMEAVSAHRIVDVERIRFRDDDAGNDEKIPF